jgi:hypothetical protein
MSEPTIMPTEPTVTQTEPVNAEQAHVSASTGSSAASTSALIIGQAAAVVAVAAALVYATGGLTLGLRLWYDQYSWEPVLGGLPRNILLVNALIVMGPAIFIAFAVFYLLRRRIENLGKHGGSESLRLWILAAILAAVLAVVALIFLHAERKTTIHGVIRPYWQIFVACWALNFVFVGLALHVLPRIKVGELQHIACIGILTVALVPAVASISAAYRFPIVKLCGPDFRVDGPYGHYADGNLIGTNGQWVYVAETLTRSPKPNEFIFVGSYIGVIPLSEVQLESIGTDASCGDLRTGGSPAG